MSKNNVRLSYLAASDTQSETVVDQPNPVGVTIMSVVMALKTRGLPITHWQEVLPDVLHSIMSLLCMATNSTPHERFFSFDR